MAEYNPSKIIKDGNTYNFRDDTKIPLAGSNAISGSLIPSSDGTVNLGSSSKKFASLNGIAPDELGLPTSTYTDVSSYITHFSYTVNTFTAPVSGLLSVIGSDGDVIIINNNIGYSVNFNKNSYGNICRALVFISKGEEIIVRCNFNSLGSAKIYHLKGKV